MVSSGCQVPGNGRDSGLINFCLTQTFARLIAKVGARNDSFSFFFYRKNYRDFFGRPYKLLRFQELSPVRPGRLYERSK